MGETQSKDIWEQDAKALYFHPRSMRFGVQKVSFWKKKDCSLYHSPNRVRVIKYRRLNWIKHVVGMEKASVLLKRTGRWPLGRGIRLVWRTVLCGLLKLVIIGTFCGCGIEVTVVINHGVRFVVVIFGAPVSIFFLKSLPACSHCY